MKISKSKLKSKLLEILRLVEFDNEEIIVTDRDRPVAKIPKFSQVPPTEELFKDLRGKVTYSAEPTESTIEEWSEA